jgi:hypothetical protein
MAGLVTSLLSPPGLGGHDRLEEVRISHDSYTFPFSTNKVNEDKWAIWWALQDGSSYPDKEQASSVSSDGGWLDFGSFCAGKGCWSCAWSLVGGSSFRGSRDRCFMIVERKSIRGSLLCKR